MSRSQLVERVEALPRDKASQVEALVAALEREAPSVRFPRKSAPAPLESQDPK